MLKSVAALLALWAAASHVQAADLGRRKPGPEFYRPDPAAVRKGTPLVEKNREVKSAAAPQNGTFELLAVEADMTVPDPGQADGVRKVRLYSYNRQPVGPVLVAAPGGVLRVRLTNQLAAKPDEPAAPQENDFHGFNVTNLHTHGLNVSPCGRGDDVFREVRNGFSHTYEYRLPADHPPGTFFYHPHKHGSVGYQVACGMVGALVVKDETRGLDAVPQIKAAADHAMVFQQLDMHPDPNGGPWALTPTQFYQGARNVSVAINGQIAPLIRMKRKEVVRWRVVHGGIEDTLGMTFAPAPNMPAAAVPQMYQIAWDGIPLGRVARPQTADGLPNAIELNPGNRAELLVQAPDADGDFLLQAPPLPAARSLRGVAQAAIPLAYVRVEGEAGAGTAVDLPAPEVVAQKTKDCIPPDLSKADIVVRRTFELRSDDATNLFKINGLSFDPKAVATVFLKDTCEEWTLRTVKGFNQHPFHVHVNPFQVLSVDGKDLAAPYWADTLLIPEGSSIRVRTRFKNFTGKTVLHCHILDHEDAGMMQGVYIVDPSAGCPPGDAHPGATPVPGLGLESEGRKLDLARAPGASVLVFFQGAGCPQCLRQLKALARARRGWADGKVRLVAVSSEPIPDRATLRSALGIGSAEPVFICEDPKLTTFKQMGCEDDGPLHGTFLISAGKVVWKDVGFAPFQRTDLLGKWLTPKVDTGKGN